ncbi:18201_t:CDS:1, partial [Racocetra persica]
QGRSIHVSEFLTDICGRLMLPDEIQLLDELPREACVITYPGKNGDGWWKSEDLINQIINHAIPIFKACFLGYQVLFTFDNATSHAIFSPDALVANYVNLGPARKQEKLRSTSYFREEIRYDQDMIFSSDYRIPELYREAKRLREVLRERGLWPEKGLKLKEARELISQQLDFLAQ